MIEKLNQNIVLIILGVSLLSCATPIGPTGGPTDKTGPRLLETFPLTETTNFTGSTFTFEFDEFIKRSSISNNITVEPDLDLTFTTKWKKKKLFLEFEQDLPDSTTIIITLSGNIQDTRNNKIGAPITVAVSTGDEIDRSSISGRLRSAEDGSPIEDERVLLFKEPYDLFSKANYQAETDTGGVFKFSYLGPGNYKALYVNDRNRNKTWDPELENAQSFFIDSIAVTKSDTLVLDPIYLIQPDTLAPELQAVGLFSDKRMRFRFNEDIILTDSASITVIDSLSNDYSVATPLYINNPESFVLFAQSVETLNEDAFYSVEFRGIEDRAGNAVLSEGISFQGSAQEDTTVQRIISIDTQNGLFPDQPFEVTYAAPITVDDILDSLVVIEGDVDFTDWPATNVKDNKLQIFPQDTWIEGIDMQFLIWNPITQRRKIQKPEVWDFIKLGGIDISIESPDSTASYYYKITNEENDIQLDSVFNATVSLENLAPISYQLIIFKDENDNGTWDMGSVIPYVKPEPIYIRKGLRVSTGFTSEVNITF